MIVAKTRKWGNSVGIVIPKSELRKHNIGEDEEVVIEIKKKKNPLQELWDADLPRITREEVERFREEFPASKSI